MNIKEEDNPIKMEYRTKQILKRLSTWLRNTEKIPTSLATRKMQIKMILRSHVIQVRMAEINKQMITYAGDVRKGELLFIAGGSQTGTATIKSLCWFLRKVESIFLKIGLEHF